MWCGRRRSVSSFCNGDEQKGENGALVVKREGGCPTPGVGYWQRVTLNRPVWRAAIAAAVRLQVLLSHQKEKKLLVALFPNLLELIILVLGYSLDSFLYKDY